MHRVERQPWLLLVHVSYSIGENVPTTDCTAPAVNPACRVAVTEAGGKTRFDCLAAGSCIFARA